MHRDKAAGDDSKPFYGFVALPSAWFWVCLSGVVLGWVLSIAELVCLLLLGKPK